MTQSPWDVAGWAAESLGPESAALADLDMAQFGEALGLAVKGLAVHLLDVAVVSARFAAGLAQLPAAALARWIGLDRVPTFEIDPRDRRFADPAWSDNPAFYSLRQYFLAASQLTGQLISDAGLRPMTERKAYLLRVDPDLWAEIERLAQAELRSVNGQVEYLLREALVKRGIQPASARRQRKA